MIRSFSIIKSILVFGCILSFRIVSAQDYYEGAAKTQPKLKTKTVTQESAHDNRGFSIAVTVGAAVPARSFSSTNVKNSFWDFTSVDSVKMQGFAKTGIHYNIIASYLFSNKIGVMALFGSSSNSFDIATFSNTVGLPFTSVDDFHTREYMIGPYASFQVAPQFTVEANAMIGMVTANYPIVAYTLVDTTETIQFNSGRSFGYSFGGAAKYAISNRFSISLNASYTMAKIVYPGWTQTFTLPGYYPFVIPHYNDNTSMPMGVLKITAGIVYSFH